MKNGKFVNFVSEKLIHINTAADGKDFANISVPCAQSKTGYAAFAVAMGQVYPATKKDGTAVAGYKNILLGKAESTRKVSIATNKKGTNFKTIELTNAEIADLFEQNRIAYRKATANGEEA